MHLGRFFCTPPSVRAVRPISPEGVCGASPLAAPAGLSLRSAPRRAQRAASEERARNERATSEHRGRRSAVRPSVGSGRSVGRRSAVGRSGRAARPCAVHPLRPRGSGRTRCGRCAAGGRSLARCGRCAAGGSGEGQCRSRPKRGRGSAQPLNPSTARPRREHGAGGPKQAEGGGGPKGKPRRGPAPDIGAGERPHAPRGPPRTAARRD